MFIAAVVVFASPVAFGDQCGVTSMAYRAQFESFVGRCVDTSKKLEAKTGQVVSDAAYERSCRIAVQQVADENPDWITCKPDKR